jgi:hypothetical protein
MGQPTTDLIERLRAMARSGATIADMLRDLIHRSASGALHPAEAIRYVREAFHLSLREASPIAGWFPPGEGEVSDGRLEELLAPAVGAHRSDWAGERLTPHAEPFG